MERMLRHAEDGISLISGNEYSEFVISTGIIGSVYDIAQFSSMVISTAFSNKLNYPYVSRCTAPVDKETKITQYRHRHSERCFGEVANIQVAPGSQVQWENNLMVCSIVSGRSSIGNGVHAFVYIPGLHREPTGLLEQDCYNRIVRLNNMTVRLNYKTDMF